MLKNCCFWTVVLEKTLESPLDCKEIQPVDPKENQSWIFIWRTDAEAETPILWPPDVKNWLIRKDPDAGKDWRQEEKGTTDNEMVGWHHRLDGYEFEQGLWVGDGQGALECCSPWGRKQSDMMSNSTELISSRTFYRIKRIIVLLIEAVRDLMHFVIPSALGRDERVRPRRGKSSNVWSYFLEKPGLTVTEFLIQWLLLIILFYSLEENWFKFFF